MGQAIRDDMEKDGCRTFFR